MQTIQSLATTQNIIIAAIVLVIIALVVIVDFLKRKHPIILQKIITEALKAEAKVEPVFHTVESVAESLFPASRSVFNVLDEANNAAQVAVSYAEQLWKNDPSVDRKSVATQFAATVFKELGITITPQVAAIIDGAIEGAVNLLPASSKPATPNA